MERASNDKAFRILIVEDTETTYKKLMQLMSSQLSDGSIDISRYESNASDSRGIELLLMESNKPDLVFLDWDLSKYDPFVSRSTVIGACDESGIPVCLYHFEQREKEKVESMKRWDQNLIMIQDCASEEELARQISSYSTGFEKIYKEIRNSNEGLNILNKILLTPENSEIGIDQYFWSRFNTLQVANVEQNKRNTRVASSLGYWINNILLQFPGPIVSLGAAASYLDILEDDFKRDEIQKLFETAKYKGPFNENGPYWWRRKIDDIIANSLSETDSQMISGLVFVERKEIKAHRSKCYWEHEGAGYYCIIRRVPVCSNPEHSVYPTDWVPLGADLSRIEKKKYEELQAWMSI